jgi:radical SAM superfamily enzyme YgiQ (UPF0313 family)
MKILVISANRKLLPDPVYPIGAAYVATICRDNGHDVDAFDCNFHPDLEEGLKNKLNVFQPDLIAISMRNVDNTTLTRPQSFLPDYQKTLEFCRKYSEAKIMLGGSGYSLFPKEFYDKLKPDYGVVGSAEESLLTALEQIEDHPSDNRIFYGADHSNSGNDIIPDRSFFDLEKYYNLGGLISVQTQRGCTFKCSYCTYPFLEGYRLITKDAQLVADEIAYLKEKFGIRYFFIVDSVFNHSEKHVMEVCDTLVKKNLKIKWSAYLRPKYKNPDIFSAMKEAGCKSIELGTDALSGTTLKSFKKSFTVDEVFNFCDATRAANIRFCHSLIFGAPGETEQTVAETVNNAQLTRPTAILAFAGTRILPNTALAEHCIETGFVKKREAIGVEPIFYTEPGIDQKWIIDYLKKTAENDKRWIIPGVTTPKKITQKMMRFINKRGLLWEFKVYATFGQRVKERFNRKER